MADVPASPIDASPRIPRSPVIFAHGMMGFDRLRILGLPIASYFHRVPTVFRRLGVSVLQTRVHPIASIAERAETLRDQIANAFDAEPVHIIAHSMGGLDARHMITHLDMAGRVHSLTTLGTPHRGTALADIGIPFGRRRGIIQWLERRDIAHGAFEDLTPAACESFNRRTPDDPRVRYFSIGGDKPRRRMDLCLRPLHRMIEERAGQNDGLVPLSSMNWGESFDVWPCDHLDMIGWRSPIELLLRRAPNVIPQYVAMLDRLAGCETVQGRG
jgi:triacylglycerol lipase